MKVSQLDKAISALETEKQIIDLAIAKLRAQQKPIVRKQPRVLKQDVRAEH